MTMCCSILLSPQRQVCQYMTTVLTQFGRPSVAVRLCSLDGALHFILQFESMYFWKIQT